MKRGFLLFILLLSLPVVFSLYDDLIFDGEAWSGKPFLIDNRTFLLSYNMDRNLTGVYYPEDIADVITGHNCSEKWAYRTCIYGMKFYKGATQLEPYMHVKEFNISIRTKIWTFGTDVSLTKTISNENPFQGEDTRITVKIENKGELTAENMSLVDYIPDKFTVSDVTGCQYDQTKLFWTGSIKKNMDKVCEYTLKSNDQGTFNSTTNLTYAYHDRVISKGIIKKITVKEPLEISFSFVNNTIKPDENISIEIKVNALKDLVFNSILFTLPADFKIINSSKALSQRENALRWSGSMPKGTTSFVVVFLSKLQGNYKIKSAFSYYVGSIIRSKNYEVNILSTQDRFNVELFNKTSLKLINPTKLNFYNITVTIKNLGQIIALGDLPAERNTKVELNFSENTSRLEVEISYLSDKKQQLSFTELYEFWNPEEQQHNSEDVTVKEKSKFSLPIPSLKTILIVFGIVIVIVIIIIITMTKSPTEQLDKEIEEIKQGKE